jgi:hypothetical protein
MDVSCVEDTDDQKRIPGRFSLSFNDGTNEMVVGILSSFSLTNLISGNIRTMKIDSIGVPTDKALTLLVYVGFNKEHGTPPTT